jgi:hypothetical protein
MANETHYEEVPQRHVHVDHARMEKNGIKKRDLRLNANDE